MKVIGIIKKYWIVPFLIIKSFFTAIVQVAWGIVALGLLGWVYFFISKEYPLIHFPAISGMLQLGGDIILNNINLFFWVFFIVFIYFECLELKQKLKEK